MRRSVASAQTNVQTSPLSDRPTPGNPIASWPVLWPDKLPQIHWLIPGANARTFVKTDSLLLRRGLSSQGPQSGAPVRLRFGITATPGALGCSCRVGCSSELLAGFYWLLLLAAAGCSKPPTDAPGLMGARGGCWLFLVLLVSAPDCCSMLLLLLEALTEKCPELGSTQPPPPRTALPGKPRKISIWPEVAYKSMLRARTLPYRPPVQRIHTQTTNRSPPMMFIRFCGFPAWLVDC